MTIHTKRLALLNAVFYAILTGCGTTTTTPAGVASVEVRPANSQLVVGQSLQLQAVLEDAAGNLLNGRSIAWTSSSPSAASVDPNGLVTALGAGSAVITATSEGVSGTASVAVAGRAVIVLDRDEVTFEATRDEDDPDSEQVNITNGGEAPLVSLVTSVSYLDGSSGWLSPSLNSTTAPSRMTLTASVRDLPTGTYAARVDVASSAAANSPRPVMVTFNVLEPPPEIGVSTEQVEFSGREGTQVQWPAPAVAVFNDGGGVLDELTVEVTYPEGEPDGWLLATLQSPTAPTSLALSGLAADLPQGVYRATVLLSEPDAVNSPVAITVEFNVEPRAAAGPADVSAAGAVRFR